MPKNKKANPIQMMLIDPATPIEQRLELLKGVVNNPSEEGKFILMTLLEGLAAMEGEALHAEKSRQLSELIRQMLEGPLRHATFIEMMSPNGSPAKHALVVLDDGVMAYTVVPDEKLAESLRQGDRVVLEGKGRALLYRAPSGIKVGEEAQLERRVDNRHITVTFRGNERCVFLASQTLMDKLNDGQAGPGTPVVVNARQYFAFDALPREDGLSHYKFLVREPVPNVTPEKDIGDPPKIIEELSDLIRLEMTRPEIRRRYALRKSVMRLLTGASGAGKSLAVQAVWRRMYEIMSEVTGVPMEQLPPRVFRLRLSQILSMWLGESDKNLDRFFTEVEQLADEPFTAPDGRLHKLPLLVIMEEIDALAKARGHEPIHDRILNTALERFDPTRPELKDKLIVYVATTNEAQQVDRAFLRRAGGTIEQFGRLKRKAFLAVLQKHIARLPVVSNNGCTQEQVRLKVVSDLAAWLFSPNGADHGLVELTYAGSTTPVTKYRRDFLTGALVDRAVQQAANEASKAEARGTDRPGVSLELLIRAFDEQIRSTVDLLSEFNASHYVDLPDGVRVANLRRLPQPALQPQEFQRS